MPSKKELEAKIEQLEAIIDVLMGSPTDMFNDDRLILHKEVKKVKNRTPEQALIYKEKQNG